MCGIIGYVGPNGTDVTSILLEGLSKLEYRGYDSAGIAVLTSNGTLELRRRAGKIANLIATVENSSRPEAGPLGIGHTRWATHGCSTHCNAHPHLGGSPRRSRVGVARICPGSLTKLNNRTWMSILGRLNRPDPHWHRSFSAAPKITESQLRWATAPPGTDRADLYLPRQTLWPLGECPRPRGWERWQSRSNRRQQPPPPPMHI